MKKLISLLSAAVLGVSSMASMAAFADASAEKPVHIYGDVNENGVIDCSDSAIILRFVTRLLSGTADDPVVSPEEIKDEFYCFDGIMKYGDVDGNGVITLADTAHVLRLYTLLSSGATAEAEEIYTELTGEEVDLSGVKNGLMLGDINENGKLDMCDAALVQAYVMGISSGISDDEIGNKMPYVENIKSYISSVSDDGIIRLEYATLLLRNAAATEEGKAEYEEYQKNSKDPEYMMGMDDVHRILYNYGITIDF